MQLRPGSLFGFVMIFASFSAFAQTTTFLTALDDRAVLGENGKVSINVLSNDDSSNNAVILKALGKPKYGTVVARLTPETQSTNPIVIYTAGPDFPGLDEFRYTITNNAGLTASATVTIVGPRFAIDEKVGTNIIDSNSKPVGSLRFKGVRSGSFSANIRIGFEKYSLVGSFDRFGRYAGIARSDDGSELDVALAVTVTKGQTLLMGIYGSEGELTSRSEIGALTEEELEGLEGRFTVELPPPGSSSNSNGDEGSTESDDRDIPQGAGWMTITVNKRGDARLIGKTGDGRRFSGKALLAEENGNPVLAFYEASNASVLGGTLKMNETIEGSLVWTRGETHEERYPKGFNTTVSAHGARYSKPRGGERALNDDNNDAGRATLTISGGGIDQFSRELRFSESDKTTVLDGNEDDGISLKINRKTGVFNGKFRDPDNRENRVKFSGVLLQGEGRGAGLFKADTKTGLVELKVNTSTDDNGGEGSDDGSDDGGDLVDTL